MADLIVQPDLWVSRMLPEGIVEKWLVADGATVASNDPIADLRIENQLRRLKSPKAGQLTIYAQQNSVVEPGMVIGKVEADMRRGQMVPGRKEALSMTKLKLRPDSLILVADGAKALFLRNAGDAVYPNLIVVQTVKDDNPPTREQGTDRPGRVYESATARRSSVDATDWHVIEEHRFAGRAAASLNRYIENDGVRSIVIVAPPRVIGNLREAMSEDVRKHVVAEIDKDLTHQPVYEIEQYLKDYQIGH